MGGMLGTRADFHECSWTSGRGEICEQWKSRAGVDFCWFVPRRELQARAVEAKLFPTISSELVASLTIETSSHARFSATLQLSFDPL
nr:hypothetical protein CFP56_37161 [Quercus suber]